jgi:uncharacterized protein YqeY
VSLTDRLQADVTSAMRGGDAFRRDTLRMALAAAQNAEKEKRAPLTEDEGIAVMTREVKRRRESIEAYDTAGRTDLADRERAEIEILSAYLPQQLGESELLPLVRDAIAESGATSARDMGRVMGLLMPRVRGRADGKVLSGLVAQELARSDLAAHDGSGGHSPTAGGDGPAGA